MPFELQEFWRDRRYANDINGVDCFPTSDTDNVVHLGGAIFVLETKSGEALVNIWFDSVYTPTQATVRYLLTLSAPGWTNKLADNPAYYPPPAIGDNAFMVATHWELETEGSKSRPGRIGLRKERYALAMGGQSLAAPSLSPGFGQCARGFLPHPLPIVGPSANSCFSGQNEYFQAE